MDPPNEKDVIKIAERDLKYLLEKTDFCMASQDPRHYLNGLFFLWMKVSYALLQPIVTGLR